MTPELKYLWTTVPRVPREPAPIEYLNLGGGENLWLSQGVQPYIFTLGDMYAAVTRATSLVVSAPQVLISLSAQVAEPEPETPDEFIDRYALRMQLERLSKIAREVLGPKTQVSYRLRRTRDTGEQQLIAEIRYRRTKTSRQRLDEFLRRYSAEIPTAVQQKVTLLRLAA